MSDKKLTILVPFKDRYENLSVFIPYMNNYLKMNFPNINYDIVVIEQGNDKPFNKGVLFNSGFMITSGNTDYYALHDIDELPISANYNYSNKPMHICVNVYEQNNNGNIYNTFKDNGFKHRGGAVIIDKENYINANGHSNLYWSWGCIDINFSIRLERIKTPICRYNTKKINDQGYFISLKTNTLRFDEDEYYKYNKLVDDEMFNDNFDWESDGLNNTEFSIISETKSQDYTKYVIDFKNNVN